MTDSITRRPPRWTNPFLLALVRTGEVREAAKWAGVDFTTAYARRKKYADFAEQWDGALETHRSLLARAEEEELRSLGSAGTDGVSGDMPSPGSAAPSPTSPAGGRGLQARRVNSARWTDAKERRFFDELVASADVRRAAEAAGVSANAVYARRAKSAVFRRRWDQALANGRAAIEMGLVAEAKRSLDPEEMDLPAPEPRVSVKAIKITQMAQGAGRGGGRGAGLFMSIEEEAASMNEQQVEALRDKLRKKLNRLRDRMIREEGWTLDEATGHGVPPGYIRDPDYVPKPRG